MNKAHFSSVSDQTKESFLIRRRMYRSDSHCFCRIVREGCFRKKDGSRLARKLSFGLESRLKQTVEAVDGAGKAQIFITAEASMKRSMQASNLRRKR